MATREEVEAEARRLGVVIDWNKFSTYGTDFKQPGPKCYVRRRLLWELLTIYTLIVSIRHFLTLHSVKKCLIHSDI